MKNAILLILMINVTNAIAHPCDDDARATTDTVVKNIELSIDTVQNSLVRLSKPRFVGKIPALDEKGAKLDVIELRYAITGSMTGKGVSKIYYRSVQKGEDNMCTRVGFQLRNDIN